ncbi:MAG: hypothetical protein U0931_06705 [Vulcanimicrobiota bacterium]
MIVLDYDQLGQDLPERQPVSTAQPWHSQDQPPADLLARYRVSRSPQRPLVLVGGFAANSLYVSERQNERLYKGRQAWPPFHIDPLSGDWALHPVDEVNLPELLPGPYLPAQYEPLLLFLEEELGYRPNENLFIFPYRWTESTRLSGRRLAGFLAEVGPADIIAHSLGGLVARSAGLFYGADIQRLALLTCPFFGAGKAFFDLHPALTVQLVDNLFFNQILERFLPGNEVDLTTTFQKMDSVYELLPDQNAFARGLSPLQTRSSLRSKASLAESWREAYSDIPDQDRLERAMAVKEELGLAIPGREYLILYSQEHPTVGRVDNTFGIYGLPYSVGGGDGTVPAASAVGPGPAIPVPGRHLAVPNHRLSFFWLSRFLA